MAIVRRLAGLGIILLSVLGLLVCIAVIFGAWAGKSRLDGVVAAVFGTADEAFGVVEIKLDRVRQALKKSQPRVSGLSRIAERLKNADTVAAKECDPMIHSVDDILDELKSAESWLDSSHTIATTVSKVSESLVSSEFAATHTDSTGVAVAEGVQEFSDSVADAIAKLQIIRRELIQIRESGKLAHDAVIGIVTRVADLDGKLTNLSRRVGRLNEQVANTRASCAALRESVHWWTMAAAVTITIVSFWFGLCQSTMLNYGRRFI